MQIKKGHFVQVKTHGNPPIMRVDTVDNDKNQVLAFWFDENGGYNSQWFCVTHLFNHGEDVASETK